MTFKFAHISDIHFFTPRWNPLQIFSKRFLGNFNHLTFRRGKFDHSLPNLAADYIKSLGASHILISGDYTCTASKKEFLQAKEFVTSLCNQGFTIYTVPGNHDTYTKRSCKSRLFYQYLDGLIESTGAHGFSLVQDRVAAYPLAYNWHLILIDCAYSTPYVKSTGIFSEQLESRLKDLLATLPSDAKCLLLGHFPLGQFKYPKAHLERADKLEAIIRSDPRIRGYLHGHRHSQELFYLDDVIIIDSGSISCPKNSSFNLFELSKERCKITAFRRKGAQWEEYDVKETT